MNRHAKDDGRDPALIVYDGDCIFCQNYVRLLRLRQTVGPVELVDARSDDPRAVRYWAQGHDLDQGMLFVYRGRVYYGERSSTGWARRRAWTT